MTKWTVQLLTLRCMMDKAVIHRKILAVVNCQFRIGIITHNILLCFCKAPFEVDVNPL